MAVTKTARSMNGFNAASKERKTINSTEFFNRFINVVQIASVAAELLVTSMEALSIFFLTFGSSISGYDMVSTLFWIIAPMVRRTSIRPNCEQDARYA